MDDESRLMAVGTYTLPICDGCKLPWLPVGWTQDSDPRNLPEGSKPLRCGKCKSIGWDREYVKQQKADQTETAVSPFDPTKTVELPRNTALNDALSPEPASPTLRARCKHRMTECPICHPKEAA